MINLVQIKQAIEAAKIAANIADQAGKIPEHGQILQLQSILLGIQEEMFEKQKKIEELERENKELKNKFHIAKKMEFKDNAYYDVDDGPFCTTCWDAKQIKIRLIPVNLGNAYAKCNACKTEVQIKPSKPISYMPTDGSESYHSY